MDIHHVVTHPAFTHSAAGIIGIVVAKFFDIQKLFKPKKAPYDDLPIMLSGDRRQVTASLCKTISNLSQTIKDITTIN